MGCAATLGGGALALALLLSMGGGGFAGLIGMFFVFAILAGFLEDGDDEDD